MGETQLIKATARLQDAQEPVRQRPIIQIDGSRALPNTIRASLESGRDNPFRPDGEIYRSADPIVDYYKQVGQNRTQSPSNDSQTLLNGSSAGQQKEAKKRRRKEAKKKKKREGEGEVEEGAPGKKKSCWRRWLCCCCGCRCWRRSKCCGKKTTGEVERANKDRDDELEQIRKTIQASQAELAAAAATETKEKQTKIVVLQEPNDAHSAAKSSARVEFISNVTGGPNYLSDRTVTIDCGPDKNKSHPLLNQTNTTTATTTTTITTGSIPQDKSKTKNANDTNPKRTSRCVIS